MHCTQSNKGNDNEGKQQRRTPLQDQSESVRPNCHLHTNGPSSSAASSTCRRRRPLSLRGAGNPFRLKETHMCTALQPSCVKEKPPCETTGTYLNRPLAVRRHKTDGGEEQQATIGNDRKSCPHPASHARRLQKGCVLRQQLTHFGGMTSIDRPLSLFNSRIYGFCGKFMPIARPMRALL